jgi:hypothetical protein
MNNEIRIDGMAGFFYAALAVIVLGGAAYVAFRVMSARSRGEDTGEAGRRALGDALPVVGASIAGLVIFFALMGVLVVVLLFALIAAVFGGDGSGFGIVLVLLLVGLLVLIGLPVAALVFVMRRRRRERR